MQDETFPVLPARRRAKLILAITFDLIGLVAISLAVVGPAGWFGWVVAGILFGLSTLKILSFARAKNVARVDGSGVTVWLPTTGRRMQVGWAEIEAHAIDPEKALGGLVTRAGPGGRVRLLPVATRDMGPEAAERLIAALRERLPKLEYRLPTVGRSPG